MGGTLQGWGERSGIYRVKNEYILSLIHAPSSMHQHRLTLPYPKYYTVGTHSRCLSEWDKLNGEVVGFSHKS